MVGWIAALSLFLIAGTPVATYGQTDMAVGGVSGKRVMVRSRGNTGLQVRSLPAPDGSGQVVIVENGVRIIVEDVTAPRVGQLGNVELEADRMVIWATGLQAADMLSGNAVESDLPIEIYADGNIVFRQGLSVVFARRMYYDVNADTGVVIDAEVNTPVPTVDSWGYDGFVRFRADALRRMGEGRFEAAQAAATTSRLGIPSYWLQSGNVAVNTRTQPAIDPATGLMAIDPVTGLPSAERKSRLTSRNNLVYWGGVPVLYWPWMATDLERPTTVLEGIMFDNDKIFGFQVRTRWNLYQLFSVENPPDGTRWTGSVDYLSERGLGLGSNFQYDRNSVFGRPGRTFGFLDAWGLQDSGLDTVGSDRRDMIPDTDQRGRVLGRHRQRWGEGYQFTAEIGWISDNNFLEQFYEIEWDLDKDQATGVELKRTIDDHEWAVSADVRLNDFFTQTEWLPRLDHYVLGRSLVDDRLTWLAHSHAGYARMRTASTPSQPQEQSTFQLLQWEVQQEGLRTATRQELDLPFQLNLVKLVPYVSGELAYFGADLEGNSETRLLGQAGIRASVPMWTSDSNVQSQLFNLNGLAHKVVWEGEFFYANSNQSQLNLPLYDTVDDDAIEMFRRRLYFTTFNGVPGGYVPLQFDERTFAQRGGLQRWISSPSTEIADDLAVFHLAARQRWQTHRGAPGRQQVIDWISLDTEGFFYPDADRDNFGQIAGQLQYDFKWHLGDRFTVLSDGFADTFADGLKTAALGAIVSRPGRGQYYLGFRTIEGVISSHTLNSAVSYRLSPKWIVNYGSTYDFGSTGNIGQVASVVRVGESFLWSVGANYDVSRNNFGVQFSIVPRFIRSTLGQVAGVPIAPVGYYGLE